MSKYTPPSIETQTKMNALLVSYLEQLTKIMGEHAPKSSGFFVLKHGRSYLLDEHSFAGRRGVLKGCYMNAAKLALSDDGLTYVEGYVDAIIPIEHAWCVTQNGKVVDPTLRITGKYGGDPDRIRGYYGVSFTTEYLRTTIVKNGVWGLIGYHNRGLYELPADELKQILAQGRE